MQITIKGFAKPVTVDDEFRNLPKDQQDAVVEDITSHLKDQGQFTAPTKLSGTADQARANIDRANLMNIPIVGPIAATGMDIAKGLDAGGGLSADEQASGDWERGILWPVAKNTKTGERKLVAPGIVQGVYDGAKSAAMLPGDVMSGKYDDQLDPAAGMKDISPELIGRGLNFAATTVGGVPKGAALGTAARGAALKSADEFGIPLSSGQASGNLPQLTKEELLRQTPGAGQGVMRAFDARQADAIGAAANKMAPAGDATNMPELVQAGLRDKVAFSKERTGALYKIAEDGKLEFDPAAVNALPDYVRGKLDDNSLIIDPSITPAATQALKEIDAAGQLGGGLAPKTPAGLAAGDTPVGVQLRGLEQVRKRISGLSGATPEDRRAVAAVKRAYDAWIDDAVNSALVSGDEGALDALKAARQETQVYKGLTVAKTGDTATASIAKMQKMDATAEEVSNWLYGANIASPTLNAPKVAAKLKATFGADSKEFQAIRAGAWTRLVRDLRDGEMLSATKVANRIEDFLNVKGSTLSQVLFTEGERSKMKAFADVLRKTVIPTDATNPSRTAFTLKGMFDAAMQAALGALGFHTGGTTGAVLAFIAMPVFRNVVGYRAAAKAVTGAASGSARGPASLGMNAAVRGGAMLAPDTPSKAGAALQLGA